jgi:hypothetical protein
MTSRWATLAVSLALAGCGGPRVEISRFFSLPADCSISPAPAAGTFLASGVLDVSPGRPHFFVGVELTAEGGSSFAGQRVTVSEVEVTLRVAPETPAVPLDAKPRVVPVAMTLDAENPFASAVVDLLDPSIDLSAVTDSVHQRVMATVAPSGRVEGAPEVVFSQSAVFPIQVVRTASSSCRGPLRTLTSECRYSGQGTDSEPPAPQCCDALPSGTTGCP